jgi:glycosyltransferase involved in cell wall biosynthesis
MMEKMRRARAVVTCTMANVDLLCEQFPARAAKIHQIYHGISSDWLTPERVVNPRAPGDRLRLLAVGRFVEKKGFSVLLDACAQLRAQEFPLELTLVGDGPLRGQFLAQCARLHLGELVQFAGWLDETTLREAYAWADLFCCPSVIDAQGDRDGLPNVVLEAMAAGLPVIGSAISGIPESIADGVTGLLVPPGDPAALAMAICCCADIDVRVPMGVQAQARIRTHFAADDWLTQLEAVLQSVLREAAETRSRG